MSTEPNHTPVPWTKCGSKVMHGKGGTLYVCECNIVETTEDVRAPIQQAFDNAAFIVKACNAHDDLLAALTGMLENYLQLKSISLAIARSDAPNWIGAGMTPEDDIHVVAARKAIAKAAQ